MEAQRDTLETILARTREKVRRQRIHRQIGALEAKRDKVSREQKFNWQARVWKLNSTIKRLEGELMQPELML